ncbi:Uncharacterised protein [Mycobacteroides abscessus subsp. massiliense]|nr:Uncharacterised protein [Mycobacteroides abscessus subsp. massiliense]
MTGLRQAIRDVGNVRLEAIQVVAMGTGFWPFLPRWGPG